MGRPPPLPWGPARAGALLRADLVESSTHKIVGSLTHWASVHLGPGAGARIEEHVVDRAVTLVESTSPSSLLFGSLDAARRLAATHGQDPLGETIYTMARIRVAVRELAGLAVLDHRLAGAPGVHAFDPLRLVVDVRGTGATGYELAALLRERADIHLELAGENAMMGVFGMAEPAGPAGRAPRRRIA